MRPLGKTLNVAFALCCLGAFSIVQAADDPLSNSTSSQATSNANNSGINTRDKHNSTLTPEDQSNQKGDRKVLADIRRAIVQDKALSISAHNVKILVNGGVVTLRGPVNSEDEKSKLSQIATQIAGVASINNQLDVKSK